jgi:hypothetical protein
MEAYGQFCGVDVFVQSQNLWVFSGRMKGRFSILTVFEVNESKFSLFDVGFILLFLGSIYYATSNFTIDLENSSEFFGGDSFLEIFGEKISFVAGLGIHIFQFSDSIGFFFGPIYV